MATTGVGDPDAALQLVEAPVPHVAYEAPAPTATRPLQSQPSPARQAASSPVGAVVDVCGAGPTAVASRSDPVPDSSYGMSSALQSAIAGFESSAQASTRAVGLYYGALSAARTARLTAYAADASCRDSKVCAGNVEDIAVIAAQPFRQGLQALAAHGSDPAVVALALSLCKGQTARSSCGEGVTGTRWATLEPDNAAAWLHVVAEATERSDPRVAAEALARAAASTRFDDYGRRLLAPVDSLDVKSAPTIERYRAQTDIVSAWMTRPEPAYEQLTKSCLLASLDDRARDACSNLAGLVADESMIGRTLAIAIGKRAKWSEERLERLQAEKVEFDRASASDGPSDEAARLTCAGMEAVQRSLTTLSRGGELLELRQKIAMGKSTAGLRAARPSSP